MSHFVGLDVSQKMTAICVVDKDGRRIWRGQCPSVPEQISVALRRYAGAGPTRQTRRFEWGGHFRSSPQSGNSLASQCLSVSASTGRQTPFRRTKPRRDAGVVTACQLVLPSGLDWKSEGGHGEKEHRLEPLDP